MVKLLNLKEWESATYSMLTLFSHIAAGCGKAGFILALNCMDKNISFIMNGLHQLRKNGKNALVHVPRTDVGERLLDKIRHAEKA